MSSNYKHLSAGNDNKTDSGNSFASENGARTASLLPQVAQLV